MLILVPKFSLRTKKAVSSNNGEQCPPIYCKALLCVSHGFKG